MQDDKCILAAAANKAVSRQQSPLPKQTEILVPIDFSEPSMNALRYARAMAVAEKAHVILLNVIEETNSFRILDAVRQRRACYRQRAERLREIAGRELGSRLATGIEVREGRPSVEIARLATQRKVDLIVVGPHQHHGLGQWLQGRTASKLSSAAPCPVLLVKTGHHLSEGGTR